MDEKAIKEWLLNYAWLGDADYQRQEVECIMSQDDWKYIDAMTEHYAGMAEVPGPEAVASANGFALSSLYECHDAPHIATCPHA